MKDYTAENLTERIRQHADIVRGHDAVHPDRNECGGVGGCGLLRAEADAEEQVIEALVHAAREAKRLVVALAGDPEPEGRRVEKE